MDSSYLPQSPEELFPRRKVEGSQYLSWKDNPATRELVKEVHRQIYSLHVNALSKCKSLDEFHEAKGRAAAYSAILRFMNVIENEALGRDAEVPSGE